jgi:hypothetical protein
MPKDDLNRAPGSILGDISPRPEPRDHVVDPDAVDSEPGAGNEESEDMDEAMEGGSRHDRSKHPGSRDVTEGTTGGVGTEVGGTRNYRQGTGATGGDIGNRPE